MTNAPEAATCAVFWVQLLPPRLSCWALPANSQWRTPRRRRRGGSVVEIDVAEAKRLSRYSAAITVGGSVVAAGSFDADRVL